MRIIYTCPDNSVSIVNAAQKADIEKILGPLSDDEFKAHVWERSVPKDAINPIEIPDDYQLPDREYRDAWIQDKDKVTHDFTKARDIALERTRLNRDSLLLKLDNLQARASDLQNQDELIAIKAKKQALRDCTQTLKDLKPVSIEEIKKAIPDLSEYEGEYNAP